MSVDNNNTPNTPEVTRLTEGGRRPKSKNAKKRKKQKPVTARREDLVCPPERDQKKPVFSAIGIACRAFMLATLVFSLVLLVSSAFKIEIKSGRAFLLCATFSALLTVIAVAQRWWKLIGAVPLVGIAAYAAVSTPAVEGLITYYNAMLDRMIDAEYYAMMNWKIPVMPSYYDREVLINSAVLAICFLLCLVIVLPLAKRITVKRMIFPCTVMVAIVTVLLTYNIANNNWAAALFLASACATVVLASFDRIYANQSATQKNEVETLLFEGDDEPTLPTEVTEKKQRSQKDKSDRKKRAAERRAAKREEKKLKKRIKQNEATVDEELDSYFKSPHRPEKTPRTPSPKQLERKQKREERRARAEMLSEMSPKERREFTSEEKKRRSAERAAKKSHAQGVRRSKNRYYSYHGGIDRSRTASSGFAGACAFLLVMAILLVPALTIKERFTTFPSLEKRLEEMREYVTALLRGDDPILDLMDYKNDPDNFSPRDTMGTPRYYTGERLFGVETQYDTGIYLRGWIGTDYKNGLWYAADDDTVEEYRNTFGTVFSPNEEMFNAFYETLFPELLKPVDYVTGYRSNRNYGFITMQVNLSRAELDDMHAMLPTVYLPGIGLREYGTDIALDASFVNYFDGIYVGRVFEDAIDYAAVAHVPTMQSDKWINNVAELIAQYNKDKSQIEAYNKGELNFTFETKESVSNTGKTLTTTTSTGLIAVDTYDLNENLISREFYTTEGVPTTPDKLSKYVLYMTDEEKRELLYDYRINNLYTDFVYDTYLSYTTDNDVVTDALRMAFSGDVPINQVIASHRDAPSSDIYAERHMTAMHIIDWLCQNYKYTLTPTQTYDPTLNGVENFLLVQKEGYCVQFASAAAIMLRQLGIPARYVEGYICSDLEYVMAYEGSDFDYRGSVKDNNEHAWIEVWYDGVGWVTYECTPEYYYEMYPTPVTDSPSDQRPGITPSQRDPYANEREMLDDVLSMIEQYNMSADLLRMELEAYPFSLAEEELVAIATVQERLSGFYTNYSVLNSQLQSVIDGEMTKEELEEKGFYPRLNELYLELGDFSTVLDPLYLRSADIATLLRTLKNVLIAVLCVAAVAAAITAVLVSASKARKAHIRRIKSIMDNEIPEPARKQTALELIDLTNYLLRIYGSAPKVGEFRDEYAKRLSLEYETLFGHAAEYDDPNKPFKPKTDEKKGKKKKARSKTGGAFRSEKKHDAFALSHIKIGDILDSIAAEEFGGSMSEAQIKALSGFYLELYGASGTRLNLVDRIKYHCILHKV